jgi:hypothetical protein
MLLCPHRPLASYGRRRAAAGVLLAARWFGWWHRLRKSGTRACARPNRRGYARGATTDARRRNARSRGHGERARPSGLVREERCRAGGRGCCAGGCSPELRHENLPRTIGAAKEKRGNRRVQRQKLCHVAAAKRTPPFKKLSPKWSFPENENVLSSNSPPPPPTNPKAIPPRQTDGRRRRKARCGAAHAWPRSTRRKRRSMPASLEGGKTASSGPPGCVPDHLHQYKSPRPSASARATQASKSTLHPGAYCR